jgi:hypothetical protein
MARGPTGGAEFFSQAGYNLLYRIRPRGENFPTQSVPGHQYSPTETWAKILNRLPGRLARCFNYPTLSDLRLPASPAVSVSLSKAAAAATTVSGVRS